MSRYHYIRSAFYGSVEILNEGVDDEDEAFITLWIEDGATPDSPFSSFEEAEEFAKKIINLLEEDDDIE
jgi:GH35 family endo-1,4-beta-xylanase